MHLPIALAGHKARCVPILSDIVDGSTGIEPAEPGSCCPIIEQAGVPPVVREVAAAVLSHEATAELPDHVDERSARERLYLHIGQVCAVESGGKPTPVSVAKPGRFECLDHSIIDIGLYEAADV